MVGWPDSGSIGNLYYSNDGRRRTFFGESSSTGDIIGCGILFDTSDKPQTIYFTCYFTRNKGLVRRFPLRTNDCDMLFPVVTSAAPAVVQVNLTATPPVISTACTLKTFIYGLFIEKTARLQLHKTCETERNQTRIHYTMTHRYA